MISKTTEIIDKFYSIIEKGEPSDDEREFIYNFELELAKSMLNEFDKDNLYKLAQILLIMTKPEEQCNYTTTGWVNSLKPNYNAFSYPKYVNTGITIA